MSSFISTLNKESHLQAFVSAKTLEQNKKFLTKNFSKLSTKYGDKIFVELEESRTILPQRFTEKFTDSVISDLNQKIVNGLKLYLVNRGPIGRTINIEFIEE
ncbi:hypothetical protein Zmor_005530 [Zophobas morio]|uniref:Uncharacterized protein n=1 Tax=Zophobas morio TaxID=2755281 RepID=A0AA38HWE3_9CUCU|nr:hypothetical protein Zmor_026541 [Zophobas morio]KAJ3643857.1 hypothetical protein Zmor_026542 [Zophobas morio]KAJ3661115.1 hypothetical protein Zmor_005530 [Zophobas morio]